MNRESLAEKLKRTKKGDLNYLSIFDMQIADYYYGIEKITGHRACRRIYDEEIEPYRLDGYQNTFAEIVYIATCEPSAEKNKLLYWLLVYPFLIMAVAENERTKVKNDTIFNDTEHNKRNERRNTPI